jgi:anti-sigma regulatory factor (Ser/Thr protein kinase)
MKLHLPNSAHLQNIDGFLRGYSPNGNAALSISSHNRYIHLHPAALAMVACAAATMRNSGRGVEGKVADVASLPYLVRMRLFDFLGFDAPRKIVEHEEAGRFIPITQVRNSAELKKVISDLVPLLHTDPHLADPIRYVISELVRNVLEHAQSENGAFLCAQCFRDQNRVSIGVADSGVGVFRSIHRSHPVRSPGEALCSALTPGVSGATSRIGGNQANAGAGLFFVKSIAKLSHNFLVLYSGTAMYKLLKTPVAQKTLLYAEPRTDRHRLLGDLPDWKGTVVGIDISVTEDQSFGALLDIIRKSYSLDVKKRKRDYFRSIRFA